MPGSLLAVVLASAPQWSAPAECPDAHALAQRVELLAGRMPPDDELRARVEIDGPPWRAALTLERDGVAEQRVVEADDCDGLLDSLAVVIAVATDPIRVVAARERVFEAPHGERDAPRSTGTRVHADARPRAERRAAPVRARPGVASHGLGLRAGAGVGIGGWDRAAGGVELALAWSRNALGVELVGRYWIRRRDALADRGAVAVELGTIAAQVCRLGGRGRWVVAGCVGIEAGDFVVDGVAAPARERVHFPWVAPLLAGRVGVRPRAPLALWLGLEAAVPVVQPQAVLRAEPPLRVYDAGSPLVRATAGIELRWTLPTRARPP